MKSMFAMSGSGKKHPLSRKDAPSRLVAAAALTLVAAFPALATENAVRKPFGEWADVPQPGQINLRLWYSEGEAYHIWSHNRRADVTVHRGGEDYGIDPMQGVAMMEYGITKRWAADLNLGAGTVGTRSFNATGDSESTSGLLDPTFGVRYQIVNETEADQSWIPTLTFRAGAVLPGTYSKNFPFAPGNRSAAIEPSVIAKKHFGWDGFGGYADAFYRWMRTSGEDQYAVAVGFFQEIKDWTLNAGWRHFQQLSGNDLNYAGVGLPLAYSPQVREISDALEAGFRYRFPKHPVDLGFYTTKTFDGNNTASVFSLGGYLEFHFGGKAR
jgi:hypothetical protein